VDDAHYPLGMEGHPLPTIAQVLPGLPPAAPNLQTISQAVAPLGGATPSTMVRSQQSNLESDSDPGKLLDSMRQTFQLMEQSLYALLSRTSDSSLNDVRRAFCSSAKGVRKRLVAWQNKHMPSKANGKSSAHEFLVHEPEWWSKGCHAFPGCNVIVREDDWGSIIAFTIG
jgi:1-phosphatidylinositol-3-phosphate 5-kinase